MYYGHLSNQDFARLYFWQILSPIDFPVILRYVNALDWVRLQVTMKLRGWCAAITVEFDSIEN